MADNSWNGRERDHLMLGRGDGTFLEAGIALGMDHRRDARGVAAADFDRDGDIDFVVNNYRAPAAYWVNDLAGAHSWVAVTAPVGTWIEVTAQGRRHGRLVTAGSGYASQDSREKIIGLGTAQSGALRIRRPNGAWEDFGELTSGARRVIPRQAPEPASVAAPSPSDGPSRALVIGVALVLVLLAGAGIVLRRQRR